jgi:hypothetical protein
MSTQTPEEEAAEMIEQLESTIEDLRIIARGKHYTREQAEDQLSRIRATIRHAE